MAFEVDGAEVPAAARPKGSGYQFLPPAPSGYDGEGNPVGGTGKPMVKMRWRRLTATGWNYWSDKVGEALYVALTSVKVFNPHKVGTDKWETFSANAVLHRPTFGRITFGSYEGVEVTISELD